MESFNIYTRVTGIVGAISVDEAKKLICPVLSGQQGFYKRS